MTINEDVLLALATARVSDEEDAFIQERARRCLRGEHTPVVVSARGTVRIWECDLCREPLYEVPDAD